MKKRDDVLVGLVIAVAIIVAIIGSLWLARGGLSKGYPLYAKFPWSAGLKQGQPVLLGGVNIGYVDEVELRPNGTVLTTFRVGKEYHVPHADYISLPPNSSYVIVYDDQGHFTVLPLLTMTGLESGGESTPKALGK